MLHKQYIDYIRKELLELAVMKYPNDPHRQMLYQIGFMQAVMAEFMYRDNQYANKFAKRVDQIMKEGNPL